MTPTSPALGVDIGGTRVRVGLVAFDGRILASAEDRLPPEGDPRQLQALVADQARQVTTETTVAAGLRTSRPSGSRPQVAGVALPGVWDRTTGLMQRAVNLPKLEGVNLRDLFEQALGCRVYLDADVNAAIWSQWRAMDPRPNRLLYLSLGTGVGGSILIDGQIVRHTRGGAGHFGLLIADTSPGAPGGHDGVPGCLSALAAGPALHLAATGTTDYKAAGDEPLPEDLIEKAARGLAVALVNLVHIYAPEVVALGGGVIDNHPEIVDRTRAAFAVYRSPLFPPGLRIERATLSTHEAGVIGAALLALETTSSQPG